MKQAFENKSSRKQRISDVTNKKWTMQALNRLHMELQKFLESKGCW